MHTSEKMIASGPPLRSPMPSPWPTPNMPSTRLPSIRASTPNMPATIIRELGCDPDGAGLVDDEHPDEHPEGAQDRLPDHRAGAGARHREVGQQEGDSPEEQPLQRG